MATLNRTLQDDNAPTVSERIAAFVLVGATVNTGSGQLSDQIETGHDLTRLPQDLSGLADQILTGDVPTRGLTDSFTFADQIETALLTPHAHVLIYQIGEEIVG